MIEIEVLPNKAIKIKRYKISPKADDKRAEKESAHLSKNSGNHKD